MARLLRNVGWMLLILVVAVITLTVTILFQEVDPEQDYSGAPPHWFPDTLANHSYDLDSIQKKIGTNKGLAKGFELASAIAYSAYPELAEVRIEMILTEGGSPMESTVDPWSMLGVRNSREYHILLNDAAKSYFDPILLRALPFDAQVGILAHELGHIAYYHKLSLFQLAKWGINYAGDDRFVATHERSTDLMPVYHGLGSQMYQYAYFVRKDSSCLEFYHKDKALMDYYYLSDEEILEARKEIETLNRK